jgi:biotin synthase
MSDTTTSAPGMTDVSGASGTAGSSAAGPAITPSLAARITPDAEAHPAITAAAEALLVRDEPLAFEHSVTLLELPDSQLPHLTALAHSVRVERCGNEVELCSILSGKTGGCSEDCSFCAQSSSAESDVTPTGFIAKDQMLRAAKEAEGLGASEFCLIYAVRGPDERLMDHIVECATLLHEHTDLDVAASLGVLTADQAKELATAGIHRYNHNLETARSYFDNVVTSHTWEDRRETCRHVLDAGIQLCCGGIIGLGESPVQRLELAFELAELGPHDVPVNFLNPRPGTRLGDRPIVGDLDAIRTIALFRLILPRATMRYGGGREVTLGDLQDAGLMAGVNAMIAGNYLTTLGQKFEDDVEMLERLEMPLSKR